MIKKAVKQKTVKNPPKQIKKATSVKKNQKPVSKATPKKAPQKQPEKSTAKSSVKSKSAVKKSEKSPQKPENTSLHQPSDMSLPEGSALQQTGQRRPLIVVPK